MGAAEPPGDDPGRGSGHLGDGSSPDIDPDLLVGPLPDHAGADDLWAGWDVMAAVSVGGAIGALARYGLSRLAPAGGLGIPWNTLLANVGGSLFLGVLTAVAVARFSERRLVRPLLGVGVLGSFTTYSSFVVEVDTLLGHGRWPVAVAYVLASLAGGIAAAAAGLALGGLADRRVGAIR